MKGSPYGRNSNYQFTSLKKSYDLNTQELYEYETMCNRATQLGGHNESIDLFRGKDKIPHFL